MSVIVRIEAAAAAPSRTQVLAAQGVPTGARLPARVTALAEAAFATYERLVQPRCMRREISVEDFARVYEGEGTNADMTPLAEIFPEAHRLALFAVTVGAPVCAEIDRLFAVNDPALACMLDAVASAGAERLAAVMAERYEATVRATKGPGARLRVLPYSPGYCGWDLRGQRALFAALAPEAIGITLNTSCLMQPLKSVSGVLVAALPEAHDIEPSYPFCSDCVTQECRDRVRLMLSGGE
jgi:hypothetical protein